MSWKHTHIEHLQCPGFNSPYELVGIPKTMTLVFILRSSSPLFRGNKTCQLWRRSSFR